MIHAASVQLHGSCISIGGKGVLLLGASGSGKSDLALRLIDAGAVLVADDRVDITCSGGVLRARAPQALQGLLEVRGVGIMRLPYQADAAVSLAVDLVGWDSVDRLPNSAWFEQADHRVPRYALHAFDSASVAKIHALLRYELTA